MPTDKQERIAFCYILQNAARRINICMSLTEILKAVRSLCREQGPHDLTVANLYQRHLEIVMESTPGTTTVCIAEPTFNTEPGLAFFEEWPCSLS